MPPEMAFEVLHFRANMPGWEEVAAALLAEKGFEAFGMAADGWWQSSRIAQEIGSESIASIMGNFPMAMEWKVEKVEETNWNAVWEAGMEPLTLSDAVGIRAPFHAPIKGVAEEFVVEAGMAFGTGHHATTRMMARWIPGHVKGKRVLDMGTGTGLLACIALRFGAAEVWAVDKDPKSIASAYRQVSQEVRKDTLRLWQADTPPEGTSEIEILLANIQLHVILEQLPAYFQLLKPGGLLLLSGVLKTYAPKLRAAIEAQGLRMVDMEEEEGWLMMICKK